MNEPVIASQHESHADSGPFHSPPPFDLTALVEQCIGGAIGLVGKLARTLIWMILRPARLAEAFVQPEFSKTFCPPLAFLALGILCGYAVMHDAWTVNAETLTRLEESKTGWAAWIAQTLIDDLKGLSLSSLVVRTLPTAIVTVLAAAFVSRILARRECSSTLASAICAVIGFKLFLRFGQGLLQLGLVWFSQMGDTILPTSIKLEIALQVMMYAYLAAMGYILFFAGSRFLATLMRHLNRRWLRAWPVSMGIACGISSVLFLGTFIAPTAAWNIANFQHIEEDLGLLRVIPLEPARVEFRDAEHTFLTSSVLLRNVSDRQLFIALPRQVAFAGIVEPVECQYESEPMLDGVCLLDAGSARVVRATWRLNPSHFSSIVKEANVPLIIQLGSVDDVMQEKVQSSTMQIALDASLLGNNPAEHPTLTAENPADTLDR